MRCANIGLFSVPLTICMEFPKHFKFLGSPLPAVPTVRGDGRAVVHSGEKKSESTFSSLYPSPPPDPPAESVLLFACLTSFAEKQLSYQKKDDRRRVLSPRPLNEKNCFALILPPDFRPETIPSLLSYVNRSDAGWLALPKTQ